MIGAVDEEKFSRGGVGIQELFGAWRMFARGKMRRARVQEFWIDLEQNLITLYRDIRDKRYRHGPYRHFVVQDTKRRDIFVASVRDRVVHQLVASYVERACGPRMYRYSCAAQRRKGVSFARTFVEDILRRLQGCGAVVAHLDVARCYASIPHVELKRVLRRHIKDAAVLKLCEEIIGSFGKTECGLPLGNITSQWFANLYLNELDRFAKHDLKIRYYMRYNDDVIIIAVDSARLQQNVEDICNFSQQKLLLTIPPHKRKIISMPRCADVLGIRMNGHSRSMRPITRARAEQRLREAELLWGPQAYEVIAAYAHLVPMNLDFLDVLD